MTTTPEKLRARAAVKEQQAYDSFERCDTDGALSQWASSIEAERLRLEVDIAEQGGTWDFPVLFGLDGDLEAQPALAELEESEEGEEEAYA